MKKIVGCVLSATLGLYILRREFGFTVVIGSSMNGDCMNVMSDDILNLMIYRKYKNSFRPKRGDVAIFLNNERSTECNSKCLVKRIVGIEGESYASFMEDFFMKDNPMSVVSAFFLNVLSLICRCLGISTPLKVVKKNHFWLEGDNKLVSYDSRFFGEVNLKEMMGKAILLFQIRNNFGVNSQFL